MTDPNIITILDAIKEVQIDVRMGAIVILFFMFAIALVNMIFGR